MIIQANLASVNLATTPKKVLSTPPKPNDDVERKLSEKNQATSQSTSIKAERTELFEQVEATENGQKANFRTSSEENRNQQFIQTYLDTKALEDQELRDELHEQIGIDLVV
ncbi:MAG TPA: hypothetical protein EYG50_07930 [Cycloclasticus sp.]|jgi:hypothetical protein|nr:hypothetical protein [Cycloclasticus sp.]